MIKFTDPSGAVREFADESALSVYLNQQIEAAKADMVPKSQLDALQAQIETNAQASYFAEIDSKVSSLIKPNDHGKSLPVFVRDKLAPVLKTIPRTSTFGEAGKEIPVIDSIIAVFADVAKVGLADYRELTGKSTAGNETGSTQETELRKEFQESKHLFADVDMTEDQYVSIHLKEGK